MVFAQHNIPHLFLKPGEMHFATEPTLVSTLLGSCVAVVMYDPQTCVGAISHCLLPAHRDRSCCECETFCREAFRYVDCSIKRMLDEFCRNGVRTESLQVKLFGGSDMFSLKAGPGGKPTVGKQNIEKALHSLTNARLTLVASDVGGLRGRKIYFYTHTGEVLLKRLNKQVDEE